MTAPQINPKNEEKFNELFSPRNTGGNYTQNQFDAAMLHLIDWAFDLGFKFRRRSFVLNNLDISHSVEGYADTDFTKPLRMFAVANLIANNKPVKVGMLLVFFNKNRRRADKLLAAVNFYKLGDYGAVTISLNVNRDLKVYGGLVPDSANRAQLRGSMNKAANEFSNRLSDLSRPQPEISNLDELSKTSLYKKFQEMKTEVDRVNLELSASLSNALYSAFSRYPTFGVRVLDEPLYIFGGVEKDLFNDTKLDLLLKGNVILTSDTEGYEIYVSMKYAKQSINHFQIKCHLLHDEQNDKKFAWIQDHNMSIEQCINDLFVHVEQWHKKTFGDTMSDGTKKTRSRMISRML